jgi:hypothetical protein
VFVVLVLRMFGCIGNSGCTSLNKVGTTRLTWRIVPILILVCIELINEDIVEV